MARATLEATCFQTKAILDAMEKDSGHKLAELAVDGGMTNSDLCMQVRSSRLPSPTPPLSRLCISLFISLTRGKQTQADLIGIPVERPRMLETTALGAAIAAGFAIGVWQNFEELKNVNTAGTTIFEPKISAQEKDKKFARWEKAVQMCRGWEG